MKLVVLNNTSNSSNSSKYHIVSANYKTIRYDLYELLKWNNNQDLILTDGYNFTVFNQFNDILQLRKTTYQPVVLVTKSNPDLNIIITELKNISNIYPKLLTVISYDDYYNESLSDYDNYEYLQSKANEIINLIEQVSRQNYIERKILIEDLFKYNNYEYYYVIYRLLVIHWKLQIDRLRDIYTQAASWGLNEILEHIDEQLVDDNLVSDFRADASVYAAEYGHLDTVQYLLKMNNDVGVFLSSACAQGYTHIVRYLVEQTQLPKPWNIDIYVKNAARGGYLDIIELIWSYYDVKIDKYMLTDAVRAGHIEVVSWLLTKNPMDISAAMGFAAKAEHNKIVELIWDYGRSKNLEIDYKFLFSMSVQGNNIALVQYILDNKIYEPDEVELEVAIQTAAGKGYLEMVKLLTGGKGGSYDRSLGWAANKGHKEVVEYLDSHSYYKYRPDIILIKAVEGGQEDIVKYALSRGIINYNNFEEAIKVAYNYPNIQQIIRSEQQRIKKLFIR